MKLRSIAFLLILVMALAMTAQSVRVSGQACCPDGTPLGESIIHRIVCFQGDNPKTEGIEPDNLIWVLDRTQWTIPWNGTVVHTYVPDEAVNVTIDHVDVFEFVTGTAFLPGRYSWSENPDNPPDWGVSTEPEYDGLYYWSFPVGVDRNYSTSMEINGTADFEDIDENVTNKLDWTISNGNMSLAAGVASANYTSPLSVEGREVTGVNITWSDASQSGISFYTSVDNGSTWVDVQNGSEAVFDGQGNQLRWRVSMSQDVALNNSPILEDILVTFRYVPENIDLWIQTTYEIELTGEDQVFDMQFPFDASFSGIVFLGYFDPDIEVDVTGMEVSPGEQPDYPGKTVYRHMMGGYDTTITFSIEKESTAPSDNSAFLYLLVAAIAFALVGAIAYSKMRGGEGYSEGPEDEGAPGEEPSEEDLEARIQTIEDLEGQKKKVLSSIKRVDSELKDGIISQEDYGRISEGYKKRAVEIMKEIDSLKKA